MKFSGLLFVVLTTAWASSVYASVNPCWDKKCDNGKECRVTNIGGTGNFQPECIEKRFLNLDSFKQIDNKCLATKKTNAVHLYFLNKNFEQHCNSFVPCPSYATCVGGSPIKMGVCCENPKPAPGTKPKPVPKKKCTMEKKPIMVVGSALKLLPSDDPKVCQKACEQEPKCAYVTHFYNMLCQLFGDSVVVHPFSNPVSPFWVKKCVDVEMPKPTPTSVDPNCPLPYRKFGDRCLFVEDGGKRPYVESVKRCAKMGGKILELEKPFAFTKEHEKYDQFKHKKFFIGGVSLFEDITALKGKLDAESVKSLQIADNALNKYNVDEDEKVLAFKRFSGKATVAELNKKNPLTTRCLILNFDNEGIELAPCRSKQHFVCEKVLKDDKNTVWSKWFNLDPLGTDGDNDESLSKITKAYQNGLKIDGLSLCSSPIDMECKDKATGKLYSKKNTHGLVMDHACENNRIRCNKTDQAQGKACPDFEIRFKCVATRDLTCENALVSERCISKNKVCRDRAFGPQCEEQETQRTGKESIGFRKCSYNNMEYTIGQCVSRGDPHYHTPDGNNLDFHGKCSYNLISSCKTWPENKHFPQFSVVTTNEKNKNNGKVSSTKAFDLTIAGTTYSFGRGGFFKVDGLKRHMLNFEDDNIKISTQMKGGLDGSPKVTINTKFCLDVTWDNLMALYVRVPNAYRHHICGMCGNFDGNPENDFILPGTKLKAWPEIYGQFFQVSGRGTVAKECSDEYKPPTPCSQSDLQKFRKAEYCGVFDPEGDSEFAQYILRLGQNQTNEHNKKMLLGIMNDCIQDHCWLTSSSYERCYEMETSVEEIAQDLKIQDLSILDNMWRQYAQCIKTTQSLCKHKPNSHYEASYKTKCMPTCATTKVPPAECPELMTGSGCVCDTGYYLNADLDCVTLDQCEKECVVELSNGQSFSLEEGESVVAEPCLKTVQCINGRVYENSMEGCSTHAMCSADGTKCVCREGYIGNGAICVVDKSCRKGYHAHGDLCYKMVPDFKDWNSAAIICGADGAHLARYDTEQDYELQNFMKKASELYKEAIAKVRIITCTSHRDCLLPDGESGLKVTVLHQHYGQKGECDLTGFDKYNKILKVSGSGCWADFKVLTLPDVFFLHPPRLHYWVGGNTHVLGHNKRNGKSPFQVDPPRLIDENHIGDSLGCYYAALNDNKKLVLKAETDCNKLSPFVCEYENNRQRPYNPVDIIGINRRVNQQEAYLECKKHGRPLLKITSKAQLDKASEIMMQQLRGDGWLDAKYHEKAGFIWSDKSPLTYKIWTKEPEPMSGKRETHCLVMDKRIKEWYSDSCSFAYFPLCGPPENVKPTAFTPPLAIHLKKTSLAELKKLYILKFTKQAICDKPLEYKCRAKRHHDKKWVTSNGEQGKALKCTEKEIACIENMGLDCKTLEVQFLCPEVENQCKNLKNLGVTPCDGGQECLPLTNHYFCRCPSGVSYSQEYKACFDHCGTCNTYGDPHYIDFRQNRFEFMGECKYKLSGTCRQDMDDTKPSFEVLVKNDPRCSDYGGTCVEGMEVHLKNLDFQDKGNTLKGNFVFKVIKGTNYFDLNGQKVGQTSYNIPGAVEIIQKQNYFNLIVRKLHLRVSMSGSHVEVHAPSDHEGKLCGLCGDCGKGTGFRVRNGTIIDLPKMADGRWDTKSVAQLAQNWVVHDPLANKDICKVPVTPPNPCTQEEALEHAKEHMCGIFKNENGPLKECLKFKNKVDPDGYYKDCMYDACHQKNSTLAVCAIVKAYAHKCLQIEVVMDWRSDKFCPYKCEDNEIYRSVASCEPTCGKVAVPGVCHEPAQEGCVCRSGYKREGQNCVPDNDCGCDIKLPDGSYWQLAINDWMLSPYCSENITCVAFSDGTSKAISTKYYLPNNAVCRPGPPPVVECAKGYTRNNSGECIRDPVTCTECFRDVDGLCLKDPEGPKIWRNMLQACNEIDGHFTVVDTNAKLQAMKKVMIQKQYKKLFIAGRVVAYQHGHKLKVKPMLHKNETGHIQYLHFNVNSFLMKRLKLDESITLSKIPKDPLALIVTLDSEGKPLIVAVPTTIKANVTCEQRGTPPDDTEWHPACNSDKIMSDNGDQESLSNMLLEESCLVCPHPLEVECVEAPVKGKKGTEKGTCELRSDGRLYTCKEGKDCIDMMVKTNCTKDVDECAVNKHDCPVNSRCINMVGAYRCKCNADFPLMIDGECTAASNCSMEGPQVANGYVFDFNGYSDVEGLFDYDCSYLLSGPKQYIKNNPLPYVSYEVIVKRVNDVLKIRVAGTIYHPMGTKIRRWAIDNDLISRQKILFGETSMFEENLNYHSLAARARFILKNPGVLIIKGMDDSHYRVRITTNPWTVHLQLSQPLIELSHGVCTLSPATKGEKVYMTPVQAEDWSLGRPKCKAFIPPVKPTPTPNPNTTPGTPFEPEEPKENCSTTDFCHTLVTACDISMDHCKKHTCEGKMKPCEYLSSKEFAPNCYDKPTVRSMIDSLFCVCKPGQMFDYTIVSKQRTCANPCEVAIEGEDAKDDYEFGCVCAPGFVLSGAKCIRIEDCGCYTSEGLYKEPGSKWRSSNCTWIYTCIKNNEIIKEHAPCGANATCEDGDSGPECECIEDHYGNPNVPEGCKPGDGPKVCYNHTFTDGKIELVCNCSRGFISNCSDCEDVDECKLGLHDCELDKEVCVNMVGGFVCECAKGYVEVDGVCKDLNECLNKTKPCKDNEGCVNVEGGHECHCCAGFFKNTTSKKCERDLEDFPEMPPESSCCAVCNIPSICRDVESEPIPLCYKLKNGTKKEFKDGKLLFQNLCLNDLSFNPDDVTPAPCTPESTTPEPEEPTHPTVKPPSGPETVVSCKDPNLPRALPPPPKDLADGPVCGPTHMLEPETHESYEEMLHSVCDALGGPQNMPRTSTIRAKPGPCNETTEPPPQTTPKQNGTSGEPNFHSWTPFGRCKYSNGTCGVGVQVRTRAQVENDDGEDVRDAKDSELRQERVCFKACNGPDGNPIGPCPETSICDMLSPVCGAPGPGISQTYDSLCHLQIDACNKKEHSIILYPGECDPDDNNPSKRLCERDGPLSTHVRYWYNDTAMECFGPVTEVKTCSGMLCDGSSSSCCHNVDEDPVHVTVTCYSHTPRIYLKTLKHVHYTTSKCECKERNGHTAEKKNKLTYG